MHHLVLLVYFSHLTNDQILSLGDTKIGMHMRSSRKVFVELLSKNDELRLQVCVAFPFSFSFSLLTLLTQYLFFLVQLEALCILTSFASGPAEHRRVIVEVGVLPQLVNLLHSSRNQDIREEVKSFISFPKNCICFFGTISFVNDSFFYLFSS